MRYCKHVMCRTCMTDRQCLPCQRCERLCAADRLIQSYLALLVSQTPPLCSFASPPPPLGDAVVAPMKTACMQTHCRANNNYFLYIFFYFLLYVFGIGFNCIIQNNGYCLHWQYWQMHQIIHLSPVGCFTLDRGKTVQKKFEVSRVNVFLNMADMFSHKKIVYHWTLF